MDADEFTSYSYDDLVQQIEVDNSIDGSDLQSPSTEFVVVRVHQDSDTSNLNEQVVEAAILRKIFMSYVTGFHFLQAPFPSESEQWRECCIRACLYFIYETYTRFHRCKKGVELEKSGFERDRYFLALNNDCTNLKKYSERNDDEIKNFYNIGNKLYELRMKIAKVDDQGSYMNLFNIGGIKW